ncbi:hypothetical protein KP509_24G069300 [Ceratopteris richardii]|uniref:Uncharacterized protein n=1 Tax=Ceratopteris richardii TaxID=49495 RepID=A0A8T2RY91_CERRI|nr:hypothetical protein KP509_1Z199200 [Ceratopteris richardii]KAH7300577.1 hypothetical protein KP509_24G069300 [Ceratopteris richardii]
MRGLRTSVSSASFIQGHPISASLLRGLITYPSFCEAAQPVRSFCEASLPPLSQAPEIAPPSCEASQWVRPPCAALHAAHCSSAIVEQPPMFGGRPVQIPSRGRDQRSASNTALAPFGRSLETPSYFAVKHPLCTYNLAQQFSGLTPLLLHFPLRQPRPSPEAPQCMVANNQPTNLQELWSTTYSDGAHIACANVLGHLSNADLPQVQHSLVLPLPLRNHLMVKTFRHSDVSGSSGLLPYQASE